MSSFSDGFKELLGTVAPVLGTAIGGPIGGIAGKWLKDKLGVSTEEEVEEMIQNDPQALIQLKNIEYDFKKYMKDAGIKEKQLDVQDRDSARNLAVQKGILVQALLTFLFITGYFTLIYFFFTTDIAISDWQKGQLGILIGVLTAAIPQMLNFWFGSSEGSKRKTQLINSKQNA